MSPHSAQRLTRALGLDTTCSMESYDDVAEDSFLLPNFPPNTKVPDVIALQNGEECFVGNVPFVLLLPCAQGKVCDWATNG